MAETLSRARNALLRFVCGAVAVGPFAGTAAPAVPPARTGRPVPAAAATSAAPAAASTARNTPAAANPEGAAVAPRPGTPIVDYIAALRAAGYHIIYSDALLTPDLRVQAEPAPGDPLTRLRAVLAPYELGLRHGPRRTWLVVDAPPVTESPQRRPRPRVAASPPGIESIVVTASRYALERRRVAPERTLSQAELTDLPALGEDALRAARVLPGLTTSGVSAKFHARGGATDETLLFLDGVRLYDPYHLKDFQSLFSSISPRMLDSVEVLTGGYPAEFGDRMSAVLDMQSRSPEERRHYEIGASLLTTSVQSSGRFADGRGTWLSSLRRGNLDLIAPAAETDFGRPTYGDFFNKLTFALDSGPTVTAGTLFVNDRISLLDVGSATAGADYDDSYLWVAVDDDLGDKLHVRYLATRTVLDDGRSGELHDADLGTGTLQERRRFESLGVKADASFAFNERHVLRFGAELEDMSARYRFDASVVPAAPIDVGALVPTAAVGPTGLASGPAAGPARAALEGEQQAVYLAYRVRPIERLTAEAGLRWDRQTYLDDSQLSPRLNAVLEVGSRGTLRAAWGRFYQAQDVGELQIADGVTRLFPAQRAEHTIIGYEHELGQGPSLRVEAYRKEFERLRPRFENLYHRVTLLPELLPDRIMVAPTSGEAKGIEVALDGQRDAWVWWFSVTRASVTDEIGGRSVPRSWDEPWSVKAGATWSGPSWTATVTATTHSGWPTTALDLRDDVLVAGPLNAERLPAFASLDVKASRRVALERGSLTFDLELQNALDRDNRFSSDYSLAFGADGRPIAVHSEPRTWLPLVPSVGVLWEFGSP